MSKRPCNAYAGPEAGEPEPVGRIDRDRALQRFDGLAGQRFLAQELALQMVARAERGPRRGVVRIDPERFFEERRRTLAAIRVSPAAGS